MSIAGIVSKRKMKTQEYASLKQMTYPLEVINDSQTFEWKSNQENIIISYSKQDKCIYIQNKILLIFSGILYNLKELEQIIEKKNDMVSLLAEGFLTYGIKIINMLEGQYSIFIYLEEANKVYIVTDKNGFFPMYLYRKDEVIYFSQSLPRLVKTIGEKIIDSTSIYSYFAMQSIIIDQKPLFVNYEKISKASIAIIDINNRDEFIKIEKYFCEELRLIADIPFQEVVKKTKELLIQAVDKQLINSNQCIWLSGGIDSSLIMAISKRELGKSIDTISIGFESDNGLGNNEFSFSRYAAKKCECFNQEILVNSNELTSVLYEYLQNANEPMISNDYIGLCLLALYSKYLRYDSTLSGVGADEYWYGYAWHRENRKFNIRKHEMACNLLVEFDESVIGKILSQDILSKTKFKDRLSTYLNALPSDSYECAILCDLNLILPEDPIKRINNVCMSNDFVINAPFLDQKLVTYSLSVSHENKLKGYETKAVLKKIAEDYFDKRFIYKEKVHFAINEIKYVENRVYDFCKQIFDENIELVKHVFNTDYISNYINMKKCHEIGHLEGNLIWEITCLLVWLKQFY